MSPRPRHLPWLRAPGRRRGRTPRAPRIASRSTPEVAGSWQAPRADAAISTGRAAARAAPSDPEPAQRFYLEETIRASAWPRSTAERREATLLSRP